MPNSNNGQFLCIPAALRGPQGVLSRRLVDRLYRYAQLFEWAVEALGSEEKARVWLKKEQWTLGGRVPLEIARYEPGAREIKNLLGRIEHGIPV